VQRKLKDGWVCFRVVRKEKNSFCELETFMMAKTPFVNAPAVDLDIVLPMMHDIK